MTTLGSGHSGVPPHPRGSIHAPEMVGVCTTPNGDELHYPVERHDEPCHLPGCECKPRVYIVLSEHQRTINEDWIPALEENDRLRQAIWDARLEAQTARYQLDELRRRRNGGPLREDWRDYIDTVRVIVRARTGQRIASAA